MNLEIEVHEQSCRGCELCIDICPTKVFALNEEKKICDVSHAEDCIACLSCTHICPANAISHKNHHVVKNFYRDVDFCKKMGKFL